MINDNTSTIVAPQPISESPMMIFQGAGFLMQMPTNWLIVNDGDGSVALIGPKVGAAHAGFTMNVSPAMDADGKALAHVAAAESAKAAQMAERANYTVLSENDLSTDDFTAYARYFHWYNPKIDMVVVQRQLFAVHEGSLYTLTSSVPNSDHLEAFEQLFLKMISSFRYGKLDT